MQNNHTEARNANTGNIERLSGAVERVTFHNQDLITITGNAASVSSGEYIDCKGSWINDHDYGLQFKAIRLNVVPPSTIEGIEKHLSSSMNLLKKNMPSSILSR